MLCLPPPCVKAPLQPHAPSIETMLAGTIPLHPTPSAFHLRLNVHPCPRASMLLTCCPSHRTSFCGSVISNLSVCFPPLHHRTLLCGSVWPLYPQRSASSGEVRHFAVCSPQSWCMSAPA
eukprot:63463-Pelagomonas_calceolata.AAC.1